MWVGAVAMLAALAGSARAQRRAAQVIPAPESVFGFRVGADSQLFDYGQSIRYFRKLAAASNRIRLIDVGKTAYGKPWTAAIISSSENLARLDHYRRINMRLAHPEGLGDAEAHRLASEGKAFVDISGGLHASEIAGSQHTAQLAYDLLSRANDPDTKAIFDNVIFFLWPSINPDGQDIVVNWCRATYEGKHPAPMELYQRYVGHDNNRDSYMLNAVESRVVQRTWREWEPDIIYVHHQSSPFPTRIWIPPFADPVGVHAPPIPAREINAIGMTIAQELEAHGQPGATHMLRTFDAWYPGYVDYMPVFQHIPAWWTETQGGSCATPRVSTRADLPAEYRDLRPTPLYLSPWTEGKWGLRDAVHYMVTASRATLRWAAKNREELLYNRYQSGRDVIRKYRSGPPYAYIVPQAQRDPVASVELLRRLAFMGIRISQTDRDLAFAGTTYPRGTWVIPMDQEYAELARELLEVQHYPDLPDGRPYDAAGWTLPFQMGVQVAEATVPLSMEFSAALRPVKGVATAWRTAPDEPLTTSAAAAGIVPPAGALTGTGDLLLLDPAQNNSFRLMNRALSGGGGVRYLSGSGDRGGRYVVAGIAPSTLERWAAELSVQAERSTAMPASVTVPARIALFKGAPGIIDEGWTEWLFDSFGSKYTLVTPAEMTAADLSSRFDVIVFGSQAVGATGRALEAFVNAGGTALFWSQGTASAISSLQLPVRNVLAGVSRKDFFAGISIMDVAVDRAHPVMAGMPANAHVVFNNGPVFTTLDGFQGAVLAKYQSEGSPLRSGWLNGERLMQGYAAAVDVRHGRGHVLLLGFQPQWRGQPHGTFRTVFNAALFGREVADQAKGTPGFWTDPASRP